MNHFSIKIQSNKKALKQGQKNSSFAKFGRGSACSGLQMCCLWVGFLFSLSGGRKKTK
jgi:hypothetical protein